MRTYIALPKSSCMNVGNSAILLHFVLDLYTERDIQFQSDDTVAAEFKQNSLTPILNAHVLDFPRS